MISLTLHIVPKIRRTRQIVPRDVIGQPPWAKSVRWRVARMGGDGMCGACGGEARPVSGGRGSCASADAHGTPERARATCGAVRPLRCAAESEAFGGQPRRLRSNRAHERSEVAARSRADAPMRQGPEREADAPEANLPIGERRGRERNGPFRPERTVGAKSRARSGGALDTRLGKSAGIPTPHSRFCQNGNRRSTIRLQKQSDFHAREIAGPRKQGLESK